MSHRTVCSCAPPSPLATLLLCAPISTIFFLFFSPISTFFPPLQGVAYYTGTKTWRHTAMEMGDHDSVYPTASTSTCVLLASYSNPTTNSLPCIYGNFAHSPSLPLRCRIASSRFHSLMDPRTFVSYRVVFTSTHTHFYTSSKDGAATPPKYPPTRFAVWWKKLWKNCGCCATLSTVSTYTATLTAGSVSDRSYTVSARFHAIAFLTNRSTSVYGCE
uniref:Uncharacterized protein n=1 Tax=Lygus hesperus TaxID=30085 RepID=A0A0A9YVK6_LYGHE